MSYNKREWGTAYNLLSSLIPTRSRGSTNLCWWQIAHEITYHFVFIMIITCWLLFKPDNHSHDIFQEKEGVYSTDDHKAFPQISQFSIMSMKTKCLTEGVRGRKNNFNNYSIKSYNIKHLMTGLFPEKLSIEIVIYSHVSHVVGNFEAGNPFNLAITAVDGQHSRNNGLLPSDVIDFAMLTARRFWRETVSLLDVM